MAGPSNMSSSQHPDVTSRSEVSSKDQTSKSTKSKTRSRDKDALATKRRCVSTACIACRRRKSKCDGNTPSCAACASVYGTECVYDPNSDHRRKGVYKKDIDNLKTRNSTLQTLIQGILNYPENEVMNLVNDIRTCENLEDVAEAILLRNASLNDDTELAEEIAEISDDGDIAPELAKELSGKMGGLHLENGSMRFVGGTSNLLFTDMTTLSEWEGAVTARIEVYQSQEDAISSWTTVTDNVELIIHLLNMYFTWHYTYFATLSKVKFFQDFFRGKPVNDQGRRTDYCTPLLVNAMLALGCHFTSWPAARSDRHDPSTAGDHFFREAKRLIVENDAYEHPRLTTVQALALMSVREAGCGHEGKGWVYSGMSFRMAFDLGLNIDTENQGLDEHEIDARRITFWGCFLFDKCWSNYLGRSPQLPMTNITVPKFEVFPTEDADSWSPWSDSGLDPSQSQPSRTRAVALQISALCEISNDLLFNFYRPMQTNKPIGRQAETKRLSDFHTRLEAWRKALPKEMEAKEGQLPHVLVMHMFFHTLFIHLFRPFLKYTPTNSPLPSNVSPRKICSQAAAMISKLLRLYKRTYGLRQICNIAVYIAHSACTIHLLNLPDKDSRRDITHGVKQLEEIGEGWPCARRALVILAMQVRKWGIVLPDEAAAILVRAEAVYGRPPSPQSAGESLISETASPHLRTAPTNDGHNRTPSTAIDSSNFASPDNKVSASSATVTDPNAPRSIPSTAESPTIHPAPGELLGNPSQQIFDASEAIFEDSKDWWLKDQSSIFDNWPRRDSFPGGSGYRLPANINSNGMRLGINQGQEAELAMFNMNDENDISGLGDANSSQNMNGFRVGQAMRVNNMDIVDYSQDGQEGQYQFNPGGNMY